MKRRFSNPNIRTPLIICSAVIAVCAVVLLGEAHSGAGWLVGGIGLAWDLAFFYRSLRAATIVVRGDGIVVRRFLRNEYFEWSEISSFDTTQRLSGAAQPGLSLMINLESGRAVRDGEFFARVRANATGATPVEMIAAGLNRELQLAKQQRC
jgi:hypothetical protein